MIDILDYVRLKGDRAPSDRMAVCRWLKQFSKITALENSVAFMSLPSALYLDVLKRPPPFFGDLGCPILDGDNIPIHTSSLDQRVNPV